jgi:hypothetical protein
MKDRVCAWVAYVNLERKPFFCSIDFAAGCVSTNVVRVWPRIRIAAVHDFFAAFGAVERWR